MRRLLLALGALLALAGVLPLSGGAQGLETSNGPITVRLPAGSSFALDAQTSNGTVTLDGFEIRTTGVTDDDTLQGTVGTGGPAIVLRTSNAPIVIAAD